MKNEIRKAQGDTTVIYIYDIIGQDWFGEGVTAKQFVRDIDAISTPKIDIRINSPGGDVFDGFAIYNAIARHEAETTAYIDGAAFSAAAYIPMGADQIKIAESAQMMIHNPWSIVLGEADDMRKEADILEKLGGDIADIMAARADADPGDVRAKMAAETWFSAQEAVEYGLADEISQPLKVAAAKYDKAYLHAMLSAKSPPREEAKQTPLRDSLGKRIDAMRRRRYQLR